MVDDIFKAMNVNYAEFELEKFQANLETFLEFFQKIEDFELSFGHLIKTQDLIQIYHISTKVNSKNNAVCDVMEYNELIEALGRIAHTLNLNCWDN